MQIFENETFDLSAEDAAELRRRLGGHIERRVEGWAVTRLVGHVALPSGLLLRIRSPKAPVASVLAWMAYVDPALRSLSFGGRRGAPIHEVGDIGALTARLFVDEMLHTASVHGLRRMYRMRRERTATVRGAIHFPSLARSGGELSRLPCDLWTRETNTPLNGLLAAATERIRRDVLMRTACGADLARVEALLAGVVPRIDATLLAGRTSLPRHERAFDPACALARLLLRTTGLSDGDALDGRTFLVNLEALFERTVVRALRESGAHVLAGHPVPYFRVVSDGTADPLTMYLDAFLPAAPGGPLVVDAKYKSAVSAQNLQQMVTYCFMTGASRAVLATPGGTATAHRFASPQKKELHVMTVPLDVTGRTIAEWREAGRQLAQRILRVGQSA